MLNAIWAVMILLAVVYGAVTGRMADVTNGALDSAGEAVSLCITMAGVVALWMGLMEIAQKAGLVRKLTKGIAPFLRFMFPRIPEGHPAREYIATNVIANVLGLGWACTPAGLKGMEALAQLEAERGNPEYLEGEADFRGKYSGEWEHTGFSEKGAGGRILRQTAGTQKKLDRRNWQQEKGSQKGGGNRHASNEMCTFLILNISSLQLIPVNMIAYRSQYGSVNPTAIIAPAIAATLVSTLVAIVYCKIKDAAGSRISGARDSGYARNGHQAVGKEYFHTGNVHGDNKGHRYRDSLGWKENSIGKTSSENHFELVKESGRGETAV